MKNCPICGPSNSVIKYHLNFTVYQCTKCGLEYCNDAHFDESFISDMNEQKRERSLKGLRKENFKRIIISVKKHLPENIVGLEIGCGYGWFLELCKENNISCFGIEPETRFNEFYRKNEFNVKNGFYPECINDGEKFDFIIFNDVIEHIPDINSAMKANYSILNKNGILIVNLPIQEGLMYFISKIAYTFGYKGLHQRLWQFNFHSPHFYYFKKKNIIELAKQYHFKQVESYKLKTIRFSEISNRIKLDQKQSFFKYLVSAIGTIILYPFMSIFPDIYCFVFRKLD